MEIKSNACQIMFIHIIKNKKDYIVLFWHKTICAENSYTVTILNCKPHFHSSAIYKKKKIENFYKTTKFFRNIILCARTKLQSAFYKTFVPTTTTIENIIYLAMNFTRIVFVRAFTFALRCAFWCAAYTLLANIMLLAKVTLEKYVCVCVQCTYTII